MIEVYNLTSRTVPTGQLYADESWVTCEECSNQIEATSGEFMQWTEYVYHDKMGKVVARYICPDCNPDPELKSKE